MGREAKAERFWSCSKRGDCCRSPQLIILTASELQALNQARPEVDLEVWEHESGKLMLKVGPCPLLNADGLCSVYDVRPYSCRRFNCLRDDGEPWITGPQGSCVNLDRRLNQSPRAVMFYASQQRHAQAWAKAHGW